MPRFLILVSICATAALTACNKPGTPAENSAAAEPGAASSPFRGSFRAEGPGMLLYALNIATDGDGTHKATLELQGPQIACTLTLKGTQSGNVLKLAYAGSAEGAQCLALDETLRGAGGHSCLELSTGADGLRVERAASALSDLEGVVFVAPGN